MQHCIFLQGLKKYTIIVLSNKGATNRNHSNYSIREKIKIMKNNHFHIPLIPISIKLKSLIDSIGIESAYSHFQETKLSNESNFNLNVNQLNRLGYYYINNQKLDEAKAVFKMNIELYPDNANVYDSYAESLMISGDYENAIIFYKKSLELNLNNENAKRNVKKN